MTSTLRWSVKAIFVFVILSVSANARDIVLNDLTGWSSSGDAKLGYAYRSEQGRFPGGACVSGKEDAAGFSRSSFSFDQSLNERDAADQLGLSAGGRAQFGAYTASASARFMRSAVSSTYSVSAVWLSDYLFSSQILTVTPDDKTATGKAVYDNPDRWNETCGDEYVSGIIKGAKLFFSIRVDFSSQQEKQSFEAEFSVAGPLASVNGKMEQASQRFSRNTHITVTAYQIGGDVRRFAPKRLIPTEVRRRLR
jgi:hypothetical protein